ncbi:MAG: hypothetical protein Q8L23_08805 [Caulobacter sp.]|nr:hypothetical protein [Caulobacter sp.]
MTAATSAPRRMGLPTLILAVGGLGLLAGGAAAIAAPFGLAPDAISQAFVRRRCL